MDQAVTQQWVGAVGTVIAAVIAISGVLWTNGLGKRKREARKIDVETLKLLTEARKNRGGAEGDSDELLNMLEIHLVQSLKKWAPGSDGAGNVSLNRRERRERILGTAAWIVALIVFALLWPRLWPWFSSIGAGFKLIFTG